MSTQFVTTIIALVLLFPLLGAVINALFGSSERRQMVNLVGTLSIGCAFIVSCIGLFGMLSSASADRSVTVTLWNWFNMGQSTFQASAQATLDPLSMVMLLVVTGVGFLIHVYSVGYMEDDPGIARFFSYMNFFIFSMLVLVLSANLIFLIIGWALVALSSYLLIGFWYERPSAVIASRKAFITQVIGDVSLVLAAFLIVTHLTVNGTVLQSLSMPAIFNNATAFTFGGPVITGICILLAIAAFAKSAQFPLHTWLPDAMEGPTPVSALIHAATMVTAGVYLIARFHPLFDRAPVAEGLVAFVGLGTSVMAGIIALSQVDIKRVIAYSTMSQIGLMIYAVGIGAYEAGIYHLVTHALFKALLFMAAGNVIHALHNEQDIRFMGGLTTALRKTEIFFLSGALALSGIIPFAGWFSKEGILGFGLANGPDHLDIVLYGIGVLVNILTGLYTFRLWAAVFRGEPQKERTLAVHEAPKVMLIPVGILAGLSAVVGLFLMWPVSIAGFSVQDFGAFLQPVFTTATSGHIAVDATTVGRWIGLFLGTGASVLGIFVALRLWYYRKPDVDVVASKIPRLFTLLSLHKFYFDELYDFILVRPVKGIANWCRHLIEPDIMDGWVRGVTYGTEDLGASLQPLQTGLLRDYASYIIGFAVLFTGIVVWVAVR